MLREWLKSAISASGLKQVDLARLLAEAVGRSVDPTTITKMLSGDRRIYADELLEIARILDYPLPLNGVANDAVKAYMGSSVHAVKVLSNFALLIVAADDMHKQICHSLIKSGKIEKAEDIDAIATDITSSLMKNAQDNQSDAPASKLVRKVQEIVEKRVLSEGVERG